MAYRRGDERTGMGQSDTVAFWEDAPNVAVTTAWLLEEIEAAVAVVAPVGFQPEC